MLKLILRKSPQKITLVFVLVFSGEQSDIRETSLCSDIMPRCHKISAKRKSFLQKNSEFNFRVAKHIGVRRAPCGIFPRHYVKNFLAILFLKIKNIKRYI